jgi:hypothetical protein
VIWAEDSTCGCYDHGFAVDHDVNLFWLELAVWGL